MLAITGVTGKSGSVFAKLLCENRDKVDEMFPDGIRLLLHSEKETVFGKSAETVTGNLENIDFLTEALRGVDTLVHIAGIHWSREVVKAAASNNVRRLICVHTTGIYSKYKEAGEEYRQIDEYVVKTCRDNNIKLSILRPTMIYGNINDRNVATFIKMVDRFPVMPTVNGARYDLQPVHYADLGKAYYDVLMNEEITSGHDYILSGKEPIKLRKMFEIMGGYLGKKVRFISCPYPIAITGAVIIYILTVKKIDMREKVQRLCEPRAYGHEDAAKDFGYAPRDFAEGVKNEVAEYQKAKNAARND